MILDKKIIGVCEIAEKKGGVHTLLQGIKIKNGKATGTNGFMLLEVDLPNQNLISEYPKVAANEILKDDTEYLIPAGELKKALNTIPQKTANPILEHAVTAKADTEGAVKIISTDLNSSNIVTITEISGDYPNSEKVINEAIARKDPKSVLINPKYLITLLQGMMKAGAERINLSVGGTTEPVMVTAYASSDKERKMRGLVMPIRGEE